MTDDFETTFAQAATLTTAPSPSSPRASLVLYHRSGAQMVELLDGQSVVVGRARPADLVIHDSSLSRQHACFSFVDQTVWVEDLDSTNGTRKNGKRLRRRASVGANDELRLGAITAVAHVLVGGAEVVGGLDGHHVFVTKLDEELGRAATFSRPLALLMVEARDGEHVGHWVSSVRALLRPVDLLGLYGPAAVLIGFVEADHQQVATLAAAICDQQRKPALNCGAALYPANGTTAEELVAVVRCAVRRATVRQPVAIAEAGSREASVDDGGPVIASPKMVEIHRTIAKVAPAQVPILIVGETGTGKEVVARLLHAQSKRRKKPFRAINCGAIPQQLVESALFGHERGAFTGADRQTKGLFEQARGGTVLLDEIGELSASAQTALLRVLETKHITRVGGHDEIVVDARVIAATHRDLEAMCDRGTFRLDLLYRLNTVVLQIPPLRARRAEILPLAERFLRDAAKANDSRVDKIDRDARALLEQGAWPGNVRQLRNVIERAVVVAHDRTITVDDLPERMRASERRTEVVSPAASDDASASIKEKLRQYEAQLLLDALETNEWNQTQTAQALDMPLRTLVHKIKQYGLKKRYGIDR